MHFAFFTNEMEYERGKEGFSNKAIVLKATHIYIIGHCNPSVRFIGLVSHTTYVACVNFIHKWRDLQFEVNYERQIFEKLFMTNLLTLRVFARNLLRGNHRRNTFCTLRLINQHTTYSTTATPCSTAVYKLYRHAKLPNIASIINPMPDCFLIALKFIMKI